LTVDGDADFAILRAAGLVIADAKPGKLLHDPVPTLDVERAMSARAAYPGLNDHPFDHCFVCGPLRAYGDGMKLCPGPVGDGMTACVWTPDESLADPSDPALVGYEFVWSAMDCPGGWTSDLTARPLVLGRMTALVERVPAIGRPVVVVGKLLDTDGRKSFTAVTAYEPDGEIIGHAEQVWIEVDPALFYSA
jgi:hypothetical protein